MTEIEKVKELLGDWKFRVTSGKLYKIKDKNGIIIPFIPNMEQLDLLNNLHYKNIILKARQLGFSTLIQILMLDQALFYKNISCGVIAQGIKEAKSIFDNKIKFAYDNLPEWLKKERTLIKNSSDTLEFNNGSSIYVSTSFRGGTLQYLHISEYGKICAKNPEKAREINTGALESIGLGNYIFIESTAEGKTGDFFDKCEKALKLQKEGKELNSLEYKFFFYPWYRVNDYSINDYGLTLSSETIDYFNQLERENNIIVDDGKKRWYQLKKEEKKDDMFREYPSIPDEAFKVAIEGSYYQKRINQTYEDKRVCLVPCENALDVHTAWDLGGAGGGDDMVVWFFQIFGKEIRFIDYFDGVGFGIKDVHSEILINKPYRYGKMFLPHDGRVASMNDRITREEALRSLGYKVIVLDRTSINDRIDKVRDNFKFCYFDKSKCENGLDKLKLYRRKWSDSQGSFLDIAEHEGSHSADGFGYSIQAILTFLQTKTPIQTKPTMFLNKLTGKVEYNNLTYL